MSAPEVAILQARVAQLQALNRSYLDTMRGIGEEYDRQTAEFLQAHARIRELEAISATHAARVAEPPAPLPSADKVLGCTRAQFLKGMEIIMRDTGKTFPEAFALWEIHARECEEERQAEARANASRDGLRAYLATWVTAGMQQKKALCTCDDWDCPTHDLVYVEGRGFLSQWEHAEELERLEMEKAIPVARALAAACVAERPPQPPAEPKPKKPMTWAERVLAGTK